LHGGSNRSRGLNPSPMAPLTLTTESKHKPWSPLHMDTTYNASTATSKLIQIVLHTYVIYLLTYNQRPHHGTTTKYHIYGIFAVRTVAQHHSYRTTLTRTEIELRKHIKCRKPRYFGHVIERFQVRRNSGNYGAPRNGIFRGRRTAPRRQD